MTARSLQLLKWSNAGGLRSQRVQGASKRGHGVPRELLGMSFSARTVVGWWLEPDDMDEAKHRIVTEDVRTGCIETVTGRVVTTGDRKRYFLGPPHPLLKQRLTEAGKWDALVEQMPLMNLEDVVHASENISVTPTEPARRRKSAEIKDAIVDIDPEAGLEEDAGVRDRAAPARDVAPASMSKMASSVSMPVLPPAVKGATAPGEPTVNTAVARLSLRVQRPSPLGIASSLPDEMEEVTEHSTHMPVAKRAGDRDPSAAYVVPADAPPLSAASVYAEALASTNNRSHSPAGDLITPRRASRGFVFPKHCTSDSDHVKLSRWTVVRGLCGVWRVACGVCCVRSDACAPLCVRAAALVGWRLPSPSKHRLHARYLLQGVWH